jgi:2-keto-4-pentenoate hydratase/2-oxohepta-3-ene-1,7-dioic acid hydratase in catechol pathway
MKIARAEISGGELVPVASEDGDDFRRYDHVTGRTGEPVSITRFLAPVLPGKIVAVGLNYRDHALEMGLELPREPIIFMKPPTSVIGPSDEILYLAQSSRVDYEAELAVVIGRNAGPSRRLMQGNISWDTPASTMSQPGIFRLRTRSGPGQSPSIPLPPWARG